VAARFEQVRPVLSPSALPTRRWRARAKNGRILLRLEVDEAALVIGLVDRGLLDPSIAHDRAAVTAAAERALEIFCDSAAHTRQSSRSTRKGRNHPPRRDTFSISRPGAVGHSRIVCKI
jgi:hypothetical protein